MLGAATLLSEVPTLGGRGTWYGLVVPITVGSEVSGTLDYSRTWDGDGVGTISGLDVNADMSASDAGTDILGSFPS